MKRTERGVGTVLTAGIALCLVVVAGGACLCIGWFSIIRQAERVAESAALAGASAAVDGRDPCQAAREAARRNNDRVSRCLVRGTAPDVVVEVGVIAQLRPEFDFMPSAIERRATAATI